MTKLKSLISIVFISLSVGIIFVDATGMASGVEGLKVTTGGNVGIGTISPDRQLHVVGSDSIPLHIESGISSSMMSFQDSTTTNNQQVRIGSLGNSLQLWAGDVRRMLITSGGNVGIGTTSPDRQLHVIGSNSIPLHIESDINSSMMSFQDSTSTNNQQVRVGSMGNDLQLWAGDERRMVVTAGGNVGIGTASPDNRKLHILGSHSLPMHIESPSDAAMISFQDSTSTNNQQVRIGSMGNDLQLWAGDNRNMIVKANGSVGIGTSSPSYTLHVNGTVFSTGAAGVLSDICYKKNIHPMPDGALKIIDRLRPVIYEWKEPLDKGMEGSQCGFIAQEVEKCLPEIVLTSIRKIDPDNRKEKRGRKIAETVDDSLVDDVSGSSREEEIKALKYNEFIPLLVKAIKELVAENSSIKEENKVIKSEMKSIKKKFVSLSNRQEYLEKQFLAFSVIRSKEKPKRSRKIKKDKTKHKNNS